MQNRSISGLLRCARNDEKILGLLGELKPENLIAPASIRNEAGAIKGRVYINHGTRNH